MEIGAEISQKIRSAITAKLMEQGAYVDDELPDYIMVMVANKKTQKQMSDDLNLFLGSNTDKFTTWLHQLLTKLQSITAEQAKDSEQGSSTKSGTESANKKEKEESVEPNDILNVRVENDEFAEELKAQSTPTGSTSASSTAAPKKQNKVSPRVREQPSKTSPPERARTTSKVVPKVVAASVISVSSRVDSRRAHSGRESARGSTRDAVRSATSRESMRSAVREPARATVSRVQTVGGVTKVVQKEVRKRKVPGSVVGSVVTHYEEEEEYDPYNPAVGNVASVVKVTERKSSVPPALQANKSLLLRAVSDAQTSIAKASKKVPATAAALHRKPVAPKMARSTMIVTRRTPSSSRYTHTHTGPRVVEARTIKRGNIQLTSRSKRQELIERLKYLVGDDDSVEETSSEDGQKVEAILEVEEKSAEESPGVSEESQESHEYGNGHRGSITRGWKEEESCTMYLSEPPDSRLFECTSSEKEEEEEEGEEVMEEVELETGVQPMVEGSQESMQTVQYVENTRIIQDVGKLQNRRERPASPKFIVTLDGVDPRSMKSDPMEEYDDGVEAMETESNSNPFKQPKLTIRLNDSDEEDEEEEEEVENNSSPMKRFKKSERCRFWPGCKSGSSCSFHHPTVQCKAFPKCKFGDKCLFIHPNCKFDAKCTRLECPFTHASKRLPVQVVQMPQVPVYIAQPKFVPPSKPAVATPTSSGGAPGQNTCRFYPDCKNMNCTFYHPKPCRYGIACNHKNECPFAHPKLPTANALKWSAKTNTRDRRYTQDTQQNMPAPAT